MDVSKATPDVAIYKNGVHFQVQNNEAGSKRLVMEATGRHEFALAEVVYSKGIPAFIVMPLSVRRNTGADDQLAKTDKIDAAIVDEYGAVVHPEPALKKSRNLIVIRYLLAHYRQLVSLRTQQMNQGTIMCKVLEAS